MIKYFEDNFPVFDFRGPRVNVSSFPMFRQANEEYVLKLNVPGFNSDTINVSHSGNKLIVSGEKQEQNGYMTSVNSIHTEVMLDMTLDRETIKATVKDGILTVTINKIGASTKENDAVKVNVTEE